MLITSGLVEMWMKMHDAFYLIRISLQMFVVFICMVRSSFHIHVLVFIILYYKAHLVQHLSIRVDS